MSKIPFDDFDREYRKHCARELARLKDVQRGDLRGMLSWEDDFSMRDLIPFAALCVRVGGGVRGSHLDDPADLDAIVDALSVLMRKHVKPTLEVVVRGDIDEFSMEMENERNAPEHLKDKVRHDRAKVRNSLPECIHCNDTGWVKDRFDHRWVCKCKGGGDV